MDGQMTHIHPAAWDLTRFYQWLSLKPEDLHYRAMAILGKVKKASGIDKKFLHRGIFVSIFDLMRIILITVFCSKAFFQSPIMIDSSTWCSKTNSN
jgi:hypothetical protein